MSRFFEGILSDSEEEEITHEEEEDLEKTSPIPPLMQKLIQSLKEKNFDYSLTIINDLKQLIDSESKLPQSLHLSFKEATSLVPKDNQNLKSSLVHLFDESPNDSPSDEKSKLSQKSSSWFESSDDEQVEEIKRKYEDNDEASIARHQARIEQAQKQKAISDLESFWSKPITDESAAAEIDKARIQRLSGANYETVSRYLLLLNSTKSDFLHSAIKQELLLSVGQSSPFKPIPADSWAAVLNIFRDTDIDDFRPLIPLLKRLDRDFWTRLCDIRYMYDPETLRVTSFEPEFLEVINNACGDLLSDTKGNDSDCSEACRLQLILLRHMYRSQLYSLSDLATSTIRLSSYLPRQSTEETPLHFQSLVGCDEQAEAKAEAALFVATNHALRDSPKTALKIISRIPPIAPTSPMAQIYFNRALALTGIAAFGQGDYRLCTRSMRSFRDIFEIRRMLGQYPMLFPQWEAIEPNTIITAQLLAALILDMPFLCLKFPDEGKVLIPHELHKTLQKEPPERPENAEQRVIVAAHYACRGDWCGAYTTIESDVTKYIAEPEQFVIDLKKTSLCCFLLTASICRQAMRIEFLMTKFSLSEWQVRDSVKTMIGGKAPVQGAVIKFPASLSHDNKLIIFEKPTRDSAPADFGRVINKERIRTRLIRSDEEIQAAADEKAKQISRIEKQVENIEIKAMRQKAYNNRTNK